MRTLSMRDIERALRSLGRGVEPPPALCSRLRAIAPRAGASARRSVWVFAGVAAALALAVLWCWPRTRGIELVSRVQAAAERYEPSYERLRWTHIGRPAGVGEVWRAPDGRVSWVERDTDGLVLHGVTASTFVIWSWTEGQADRWLIWMRDPAVRSPEGAIPGPGGDLLRHPMLAHWLRVLGSHVPMSATSKPLRSPTGELLEVEVTARLPGGVAATVTAQLTADLSEIRYYRLNFEGRSVDSMMETEEIDYQRAVDLALLEPDLAAGTRCTYDTKPIEPVWEHLPETDRAQIRQLLGDLDRAIRTGDAALGLSLWDLSVLSGRQLQGKCTAAFRQRWWGGWFGDQPARFRSYQTELDYVFAADWLPNDLTNFESVYRVRPGGPDDLLALAFVTAELTGEITPRQARTIVYLRKSGGSYRICGWCPPLG